MFRTARRLTLATLLTVLAACGGEQTGSEPAAGSAPPAPMGRTAAVPGAAVFIISPVNGSTVSSPVAVKFGISGMTVAAAGDYSANSGHHHLLIDTDLADPEVPVPSDAQHLHFGKGQTETMVELAPGQHTLQLVLGDGNHIPHDPPIMSEIVTITVE